MSDNNKTTVLFRDYNLVWCSLSDMYWSTQTHSLLSRHPVSTVEEIVSNFCPQCLSRYTEDEVVASLGRCPNCKECPFCQAILTSDSDGLSCGFCFWRCSGNDTLEMSTWTGSGNAFFLIQTQLKSDCQKTENYGQPNKIENKGKIWQMEELKLKLENSANENAAVESRFIQQLNILRYPDSHNTLLPNSVTLLTKRALRSRQDTRSGRMNILMQPKTLPLEGDSSLKLQKGKWWVKDSSAIHELPFVSLLSVPSQEDLRQPGSVCTVALCLMNPKMSDVTVSFRADTLSPASANYMAYRSGGGGAQWVRASDRVSLGVSKCLRAGTGIGSDVLDITIGAFEDELLKDASSEEEPVEESTTGGAEGNTSVSSADGGAATGGDGFVPHWTYRVVHNKAYIIIPVFRPEHFEECYHGDCSWELNLHCSIKWGGAAEVELPFKILFGKELVFD